MPIGAPPKIVYRVLPGSKTTLHSDHHLPLDSAHLHVLFVTVRLFKGMSSSIPISQFDPTAPTPQNTPLTHAPIAAGLSRPTVPDITEGDEPAEDEEDELPAGAHAAMLGLVHGRLAELVGRSSGYIENLPESVKRSVEALKGVQVKHNELQTKYKLECLELEKKVRLSCFCSIF